jgi:hypothetical protein
MAFLNRGGWRRVSLVAAPRMKNHPPAVAKVQEKNGCNGKGNAALPQ